MTERDIEFRKEFAAFLRKHEATIDWSAGYYPGDTEDMRFTLKDSPSWIDLKDIARDMDQGKL